MSMQGAVRPLATEARPEIEERMAGIQLHHIKVVLNRCWLRAPRYGSDASRRCGMVHEKVNKDSRCPVT